MASQPVAPEASPLHAAVVFVGHHHSGKSTIAGHLIMKLGGLDRRAVERLERETSNRPASKFAWVLDRSRLERDRAMTCDLKLSRALVAPSPSHAANGKGGSGCNGGAGAGDAAAASTLALTLVDTPGHSDYLRNAIAGITQSDLAVLVVDSLPAVMEAPTFVAQTRDMALLALSLANFRSLVVAVNHMDLAVEAGVAEQRFNDARAALSKLLKRFLRPKEEVTYVPISGFAGDNLTEPSPRLPWWRGETLVEAIQKAVTAGGAQAAAGGTAGRGGGSGGGGSSGGAAADLPLRMPILTVFKVGGIGTVPAGRLAAGRLSRGGRPVLLPPPRHWQTHLAPSNGAEPQQQHPGPETAATAGAGAPVAVRSIESFHDSLAAAEAGDFVGLSVKGLPSWALRRGCVVCDGAGGRPARLAAEFTARVQVVRDPSSKREGHERHMRVGYCLLIHVHTAQVPCRLASINRLNTKNEVVEEGAAHLREGDIARVQLVPLRPLVVETFEDYPSLGRFAARGSLPAADGASGRREGVVAIGRVEHVTHVRPDAPSEAPPPVAKKRSSSSAAKAQAEAAAVESDASALLHSILAGAAATAITPAVTTASQPPSTTDPTTTDPTTALTDATASSAPPGATRDTDTHDGQAALAPAPGHATPGTRPDLEAGAPLEQRSAATHGDAGTTAAVSEGEPPGEGNEDEDEDEGEEDEEDEEDDKQQSPQREELSPPAHPQDDTASTAPPVQDRHLVGDPAAQEEEEEEEEGSTAGQGPTASVPAGGSSEGVPDRTQVAYTAQEQEQETPEQEGGQEGQEGSDSPAAAPVDPASTEEGVPEVGGGTVVDGRPEAADDGSDAPATGQVVEEAVGSGDANKTADGVPASL